MQKKTKKRLIIASVIIAVLALVLFLVYYGVNTLFFMVGDSFYQSDVVIESHEPQNPAATPSEPAGESGSAGPSAAPSEKSSGGAGVPDTANQGTAERVIPFDKLNLTLDEFRALQEKVPFADKMAALAILSKGLTAADYTELIGMLGGGISSSEVKRAYVIIGRGLYPEDKAKIWGYYDKYKYLLQ